MIHYLKNSAGEEKAFFIFYTYVEIKEQSQLQHSCF